MPTTDDRAVWFVDTNGASITDDVTIERFATLLDAFDGSDPEHGSLSASDEDGWNLEIYPDVVSFENVEPGGSVVGSIRSPSRDDLLGMVRELLDGDLDALRRRPWA